jgi:hypothetical protein
VDCNALVLAKPDRTDPPIPFVRLDDDQVRMILTQLAKANTSAKEDARNPAGRIGVS